MVVFVLRAVELGEGVGVVFIVGHCRRSPDNAFNTVEDFVRSFGWAVMEGEQGEAEDSGVSAEG